MIFRTPNTGSFPGPVNLHTLYKPKLLPVLCLSLCEASSSCQDGRRTLENPLNGALAMLSTSMFVTAIASLSASLVVYGLYKVLTFIYGELTSPLRAFPGPPSPSFIFGHLRELRESVSYHKATTSMTCLIMR